MCDAFQHEEQDVGGHIAYLIENHYTMQLAARNSPVRLTIVPPIRRRRAEEEPEAGPAQRPRLHAAENLPIPVITISADDDGDEHDSVAAVSTSDTEIFTPEMECEEEAGEEYESEEEEEEEDYEGEQEEEEEGEQDMREEVGEEEEDEEIEYGPRVEVQRGGRGGGCEQSGASERAELSLFQNNGEETAREEDEEENRAITSSETEEAEEEEEEIRQQQPQQQQQQQQIGNNNFNYINLLAENARRFRRFGPVKTLGHYGQSLSGPWTTTERTNQNAPPFH
ncbi:hypothetical protein RF55_7960 [Lasius niger]|uniref:Uncharacterized protein n=1 Tax=Lasius niger TaxID=67767 RepID=A0A0J7KPD9_LASNI|nr:hypothetical protein RF55_7960 [Lasius niger]